VSVSERYQTISAWPPRFARPTASINGWGAVAWSKQTGFVEATPRRAVEIYARVGGGDSFPPGCSSSLTCSTASRSCAPTSRRRAHPDRPERRQRHRRGCSHNGAQRQAGRSFASRRALTGEQALPRSTATSAGVSRPAVSRQAARRVRCRNLGRTEVCSSPSRPRVRLVLCRAACSQSQATHQLSRLLAPPSGRKQQRRVDVVAPNRLREAHDATYAAMLTATDALTAAPTRRTAREMGSELCVEPAGVCWLDRSWLTRVLGRTVARADDAAVRPPANSQTSGSSAA
jgi:hypothetical protein